MGRQLGRAPRSAGGGEENALFEHDGAAAGFETPFIARRKKEPCRHAVAVERDMHVGMQMEPEGDRGLADRRRLADWRQAILAIKARPVLGKSQGAMVQDAESLAIAV